MTRFGIMISGNGTNLQSIINAIDAGHLQAEIAVVISSRPDAYGLVRAADAGIPTVSLSSEVYQNPWSADEMIVKALQQAEVDYVVLAGYMRKVYSPILESFEDRVINLHPSLQPSFPGGSGIEEAFEYGVKVTGVTVHFANEQYDEGPIIAQRAISILEGDTVDSLTERIHAAEHELLPQVMQLLVDGRVQLGDNRKVRIL